MRTFKAPAITTRNDRGPVKLDYAFQIKAEYDPKTVTPTPHGDRIFQQIIGGTADGPKLKGGRVRADSGGDYNVLRPDRVEDVTARFLIEVDGELIFVQHVGYWRHSDGYYRFTAYFDADQDGKHTWMQDAVFVATAQPNADGRHITYTYYEAV
jgi:hypothetical protein